MDAQRILTELGRRLRAARQDAGLNVSDLARRAGLSRRYVTEAEAGRANLSFLKLAALAGACDVPMRELCDLELGARPSERIALVGLRGAGKSTLGRRLALAREVPFIELDQRIEAIAGLSLGELFGLHGEQGFQRFEAEALEQVLAEGGRWVLATGGSIVEHEATFKRLRASCLTVWLRADPADHFRRVVEQGDRRPMADHPRAMAELEALLRARAQLYEQCDITLFTSGRTLNESLLELEQEIVADAHTR
jgi:XRE family transcriptional regulator, aerobic/anaerobic benzoate catabolism transcriptional regulator